MFAQLVALCALTLAVVTSASPVPCESHSHLAPAPTAADPGTGVVVSVGLGGLGLPLGGGGGGIPSVPIGLPTSIPGSGSGSLPTLSDPLSASLLPTGTLIPPLEPHSSASPTGTGTVAQWGQCGGIGYTGPTTCASGFTCHVLTSCE